MKLFEQTYVSSADTYEQWRFFNTYTFHQHTNLRCEDAWAHNFIKLHICLIKILDCTYVSSRHTYVQWSCLSIHVSSTRPYGQWRCLSTFMFHQQLHMGNQLFTLQPCCADLIYSLWNRAPTVQAQLRQRMRTISLAILVSNNTLVFRSFPQTWKNRPYLE